MSKTVTMLIAGDFFAELGEHFEARLPNPVRTSIPGPGQTVGVEITDDDPPGLTTSPNDQTTDLVMRDTQELGRGLIVGTPRWPQRLAANKEAFGLTFVARGRFKTSHPASPTPTRFVDRLNANAGNVPFGVLSIK